MHDRTCRLELEMNQATEKDEKQQTENQEIEIKEPQTKEPQTKEPKNQETETDTEKETEKEKEKETETETETEKEYKDNKSNNKKKFNILEKIRTKRKNTKPEEINIVKELLDLILYVCIVILLCFIIITYVGQRSRVHGSSMNPTLDNDDYIWVDKLVYKIKEPKRFDVIVFKYQGSNEYNYVKRIIGLPGETVLIDTSGNIYIDGKLLKENYGNAIISSNDLGIANQPVKVGKDEYFVLGDNRNNSHDSRKADVGNVEKDDIIGKATFRMSPLKHIGFIK